MRVSQTAAMGHRLRLAVILTSLILGGELVGGYLANSLALLSDAGHVFTDLVALSLSWLGIKQAERAPTAGMTYGYHRVGILIALINAMTLVAIAAVILVEAVRRLQEPPVVAGPLMLLVASIGLGVNLVAMGLLRSFQAESLNLASAFLHVLGDALGSVGVIVGALVLMRTGWYWVDPAVSVFIAVIIVFGSWRIVREGLGIFLEASPQGLDLAELVRAIDYVPGIKDVHDLHVWTIAPQLRALSCHILVDDVPVSEASRILTQLNEVLDTRFRIGHSTVQLECEGCDPNELYCRLGPEGEAQPSTSSTVMGVNSEDQPGRRMVS